MQERFSELQGVGSPCAPRRKAGVQANQPADPNQVHRHCPCRLRGHASARHGRIRLRRTSPRRSRLCRKWPRPPGAGPEAICRPHPVWRRVRIRRGHAPHLAGAGCRIRRNQRQHYCRARPERRRTGRSARRLPGSGPRGRVPARNGAGGFAKDGFMIRTCSFCWRAGHDPSARHARRDRARTACRGSAPGDPRPRSVSPKDIIIKHIVTLKTDAMRPRGTGRCPISCLAR